MLARKVLYQLGQNSALFPSPSLSLPSVCVFLCVCVCVETWACFVVQANLSLVTLLPQFPKCGIRSILHHTLSSQ